MADFVPILVSTAHLLRASEDTIRLSAIRGTYLQKFSAYRLLPLIVSPDLSRELCDELYCMAAGVLFLGGADVAPEFYGESAHPETKATERERDLLEIELCRRALHDRKPILGICRGAQLLAVAAGGTLIQHIPDHSDVLHNRTYEAQLQGPSHTIVIEEGTQLQRILHGAREGMVTSAHHQAVKSVPADFRVAARSPDGIVEAIERREGFCIGVQPHPETEQAGFLEPVFQAFRDSAGAFSPRST